MILDLTFRSFPGHNTVGLMCKDMFNLSLCQNCFLIESSLKLKGINSLVGRSFGYPEIDVAPFVFSCHRWRSREQREEGE
jgi:hypothetical protein